MAWAELPAAPAHIGAPRRPRRYRHSSGSGSFPAPSRARCWFRVWLIPQARSGTSNKGGKTTLAAALVRAGHALLTDDLLAVEPASTGFRAQPGYPQMRMWPEGAEYFVGGFEDLELAHPGFAKRRVPVDEDHLGSFHDASAPLRAIYVPQRRDDSAGGVAIEPLPSSTAIQELLRASFIAPFALSAGRSGTRLRLLGNILALVSAKRLSYSDGLDRLHNVVTAIERESTPGR